MNQQLAIERIVQNLDEPLREDQFIALCAALRVTDQDAIEWALDWLSMSSFSSRLIFNYKENILNVNRWIGSGSTVDEVLRNG